MTQADIRFMEEALALAREAAAEGEVPVGCVVTLGDRIVGRGRNRRETDRTALAHAELEAIAGACQTLGGWRLWQCTLYVTLEPCPMCAGAISQARISRLIYGASAPAYGCAGSVYAIPEDPAFGRRIACMGGLLESECREILDGFFEERRG